jgi:hypothetical protein
MGIHQGDQFIEDSFCNISFSICAGGEVFEIDFMFDGFSQSLDKAHVDIGFKQCGADFLERGIKLLEEG